MDERIICSGFGGQGVMSLGQMICYMGMKNGFEVSWLPSYGPEMRGGTANCTIMVSDELIGSPIINHDATVAIVMNKPSLTKFEKELLPNGKLFINSSLIEDKSSRDDVTTFYINANDIASKCGSPKMANLVILGAYLESQGGIDFELAKEAFLKVFGEGKAHLWEGNVKALEAGAKAFYEKK